MYSIVDLTKINEIELAAILQDVQIIAEMINNSSDNSDYMRGSKDTATQILEIIKVKYKAKGDKNGINFIRFKR